MRRLGESALIFGLIWAAGCGECQDNGDCKTGEACRSGECRKLFEAGGDLDSDADGDADTGGGGEADSDADGDSDSDADGDADAGGGGGGTPCGERVCWQPPENACSGSPAVTVYLTKYAPNGYCEGSRCRYPSVEDRCSTNACSDGACVSSQCEGVACYAPPAPVCADADNLRVYNRAGRCKGVGGGHQCIYDQRLIACPGGGCAAGKCTGEPCAGVTCDRPPARYCADGETLVAFDTPGYCEGGQCQYRSREVACADGCDQGVCQGAQCPALQCLLPPASYCTDDMTLRSFSSDSTCDGAFCRFAASDAFCTAFCEDGQCLDDPCLGVRCDTPPAGYCRGDALVGFESPGTCLNGACDYLSSETACPGGCASGACL